MAKYRIQYINGHSLKYEVFTTEADSRDEAISKLWDQFESDFDHRIIDVYVVGEPDHEGKTARLIEEIDFVNADKYGKIPMWVSHKFDGNWQCLDAECVKYYRTDDYTMVEMWTSKPTTEQIIAVMENREKHGHIWAMWRDYIPKEDEEK